MDERNILPRLRWMSTEGPQIVLQSHGMRSPWAIVLAAAFVAILYAMAWVGFDFVASTGGFLLSYNDMVLLLVILGSAMALLLFIIFYGVWTEKKWVVLDTAARRLHIKQDRLGTSSVKLDTPFSEIEAFRVIGGRIGPEQKPAGYLILAIGLRTTAVPFFIIRWDDFSWTRHSSEHEAALAALVQQLNAILNGESFSQSRLSEFSALETKPGDALTGPMESGESLDITEENILKCMPDDKWVKIPFLLKALNIKEIGDARYLEIKMKGLLNRGKIERELQDGKSYYKKK
nr:hypothetical protein [Candidatus Sigynarchaeota archaeon]